MVSYSTYTIHRRKDLYGEDADEFKPERWEKLRPGWEYLPFNGGPRICLGREFLHLHARAAETDICYSRAIRSYGGWLYYSTNDAGIQIGREPRFGPVGGRAHIDLYK